MSESRNDYLVAAAVAFRESLVPRADRMEHGQYPLWNGWAIYDAFVAGAQYATQSEKQATISAGELAELRKAIGELAMAMGNPAVQANGDQTIESQTVREALRRVKETVAAVRRIRDAGIDVEAPL